MPDRTALRLKTGRTHVVSLILDPHDEILNFSQSLVSGLSEAFRGTPYHLVITPTARHGSPLDPINYVLRNRMADGVIFSRTEPERRAGQAAARERFPVRQPWPHRNCRAPHPYVDYDNFTFAYEAVKRLHAKGRRHVSMIAAPPRFTFGRHLRDGVMRAARRDRHALRIRDAGDARRQRRGDPPARPIARIARGQPARRLCVPGRRGGAGGDRRHRRCRPAWSARTSISSPSR